MEENAQFLSADEIADIFGETKANEFLDKGEELKEPETQTNNKSTDEDTNLQESRGREDESKTGGNTESTGSPNNFYSSIAKALKDEGIFPDLDDNIIGKVIDASTLKQVFEGEIYNRQDNITKRVMRALNAGVEEPVISKIETTLNHLIGLKKNGKLEADTKEMEEVRSNLIYQDFINKGYSKERAKKEVDKSIKLGTDIDDAKEALEANLKFYQAIYNGKIEEAEKMRKDAAEVEKREQQDFIEAIKKTDKAFDSISLTDAIKDKIIRTVIEKKYKTSDGSYDNALGKYFTEKPLDYIKYVSMFYTLTDGFTDFSKLFQPIAKQEMKKGLSQLEDMLQGKINPDSGSMKVLGDGNSGLSFDFSDWDIDL